MSKAIKPWYKSRTLLFNVVVLVLGILEVVTGVYAIPADILVLVNGVGNVLLRFLTSEPIK